MCQGSGPSGGHSFWVSSLIYGKESGWSWPSRDALQAQMWPLLLTCRASPPCRTGCRDPVARAGGQHWAGMSGRGARPGAGGYGHSADQSFQRMPAGRWEAAASGTSGRTYTCLAQTLEPGAWALIGDSQKPSSQADQEWWPGAQDPAHRQPMALLPGFPSPVLSCTLRAQAQFPECLTWESLPWEELAT